MGEKGGPLALRFFGNMELEVFFPCIGGARCSYCLDDRVAYFCHLLREF